MTNPGAPGVLTGAFSHCPGSYILISRISLQLVVVCRSRKPDSAADATAKTAAMVAVVAKIFILRSSGVEVKL